MTLGCSPEQRFQQKGKGKGQVFKRNLKIEHNYSDKVSG